MNRSERETTMNISAADRVGGGAWEVYSDDPAMVTKLRRVAKPYKKTKNGGYFFRLPVKCVSFRSPRDIDLAAVEEFDLAAAAADLDLTAA